MASCWCCAYISAPGMTKSPVLIPDGTGGTKKKSLQIMNDHSHQAERGGVATSRPCCSGTGMGCMGTTPAHTLISAGVLLARWHLSLQARRGENLQQAGSLCTQLLRQTLHL